MHRCEIPAGRHKNCSLPRSGPIPDPRATHFPRPPRSRTGKRQPISRPPPVSRHCWDHGPDAAARLPPVSRHCKGRRPGGRRLFSAPAGAADQIPAAPAASCFPAIKRQPADRLSSFYLYSAFRFWVYIMPPIPPPPIWAAAAAVAGSGS